MAKRSSMHPPSYASKPKKACTTYTKLSSSTSAGNIEELNSNIHLPGPNFKERLRNTAIKPHSPSVSELEELDHLIVNIAYHIEQLLVKFQWLRSVDLDSLSAQDTDAQLVRSLMKRHRIRLASLLVKQYWIKGIPVFDDIVFTRHSANISNIPELLGTGSLNPTHLDQLQALLLQSAVDSYKMLKQRFADDQIFLKRTQRTVHDLKKMTLPSFQHTTGDKDRKWSMSEKELTDKTDGGSGSKWPPELPQIQDDAVLKQVFTHKSAITDASMNSATDLIHTHNERLEFKGDSILDFIVCQMLYDEFPNDSEGALSIKKASLVCNDTLFDLSVEYRLYEWLQISSDLHSKIYTDINSTVPDPDRKHKAVADVFEAYIAGLAMDRGLTVVQDWLKLLYQPLVEDMKNAKVVNEVDKNSKNELYRKVGSATQPIVYVTVNDSSPFVVKCLIAGEEVSRGTDRTIKLAGLRAAEAVLKQPKLVEKYAAIRRESPKTAPDTSK